MYTGLELAIIGYILGFVIHIGFLKFFKGFYDYVSKIIPPAAWCFTWPIAWAIDGAEYVFRLPILLYYAVEYIITGQWNYNK